MKQAQKRLDRGAKALMRLIAEAERGAQEACDAGQFEASERLHRMAAYMRMAYAEGRGLRMEHDGEVIAPRSGGK